MTQNGRSWPHSVANIAPKVVSQQDDVETSRYPSAEGNMPFNEDRLILNMTDMELEDLVKKWIARLKDDYLGFERPTASADMGRDAVGFLSAKRYDGEWHNYQCKHLKAPLGIAEFAVELGKIFYYSCIGEFTVPTKYIFVAPNSSVRDVKKMVDRPSLIMDFLIRNWNKYCLNGISKVPCPLTSDIEAAIKGYDFTKVELWKASELVEKTHMRAVLHEHMDIDPGEAPRVWDCDVPAEVGDDERPYVNQLIKVFSEAGGTVFQNHDDIVVDTKFGPQMIIARRRYLERKAFRRHFRDNLPGKQIDGVDADVHATVFDLYHAMGDGPLYKRLTELMTTAASASIVGPLGRHNRVTPSVKQGVCHHFANTGAMPWA
jgi:hypothetical protein